MHNLKTNFLWQILWMSSSFPTLQRLPLSPLSGLRCEMKPHATPILTVYSCSWVSCSWHRPLAEQQAIITIHVRIWLFNPWRWRHYFPSKQKKPFTQWYSVTSQKTRIIITDILLNWWWPNLVESTVIGLNPTSCLKLRWPPSLIDLCNLLLYAVVLCTPQCIL